MNLYNILFLKVYVSSSELKASIKCYFDYQFNRKQVKYTNTFNSKKKYLILSTDAVVQAIRTKTNSIL